MKTHIVYTNTVPYKRYQITPLKNGKYKVKGYMMSRSIWHQMMDATLNEAQFCRISTPKLSAALANPHTVESCLALPALF